MEEFAFLHCSRKAILPVVWPRKIIGYVRSARIYRRNGEWFASFMLQYARSSSVSYDGVIGVDRNSVGRYRRYGRSFNGSGSEVRDLSSKNQGGYSGTASKNLQRTGKTRILKKLRRKQRPKNEL